MQHQEVVQHFNALARRYDGYKRRTPFYHTAIVRSLRPWVSDRDTVLDYGCGTGDVLMRLQPRWGYGYDPSAAMIALAKRKHPSQPFSTRLPRQRHSFSRIILVDVIEHAANRKHLFAQLATQLAPNGLVLLSYVDARWEPILMILEKLGLKMPEGPHARISRATLLRETHTWGWRLVALQQEPLWDWLPWLRPLTLVVLQPYKGKNIQSHQKKQAQSVPKR